ncbi:MAG: CrcB family protein [Myxococcota bacterium]
MSAPLAPGTGPIPVPAAAGALRETPWVAFGGALGAASRSGVASLLAGVGGGGGGLVATQAVNLAGAFALGLLLGTLEAIGPRPRLRAFLGIGVLGSFTTYSTLVAEARAIAEATSPGVALAFLLASVALGLAAFVAGGTLARRGRLGGGASSAGGRERRS